MADYFPPPDNADGWRTCDPADVGMRLDKLDEAFEFARMVDWPL